MGIRRVPIEDHFTYLVFTSDLNTGLEGMLSKFEGNTKSGETVISFQRMWLEHCAVLGGHHNVRRT